MKNIRTYTNAICKRLSEQIYAAYKVVL